MHKKGFSYAEAMVTMLVVAIIMVATAPILSKKLSATKNGTIWGWASNDISTFFGTPANGQRVLIGNQAEGQESARLVVYEASDNRENAQKTLLPPIMMFRNRDNDELARLIVNNTTVGLGFHALNAMPIGILNSTAIGAGALSQATVGHNTAIGFNACSNIITGQNNICIGADVKGEEGSNQLFIGNFIEAKEGTITIPEGKTLEIKAMNESLGTKDVALAIYKAYNTPSDLRLKNILGASTAGLNEINKIDVKKFTYKKDKRKTPHVGVIAQELRNIFPNSVVKDKDGYLAVNREEMFFAMLNAIKELSTKFNTNEAKVQNLQKEVETLRQENATLNQRITALEQKLNK